VKRLLIAVVALASMRPCGGASASGQSMDDLNLQVHGYATQGFIYSNQNSWNTTDSENGSASWTDAVVNLSLQPEPKLRIGVQARFYLMGDFGNQIILDWAQLDYKVNDHLGFRVGDVKTPMGLLNETQDIDPANLWVLLPQSVYPIASRNSILDHFGGVAYGAVALGERFGKLEYRAFGGERELGGDDGYFQGLRDSGFTLPNGLSGPVFGGTLRWNAPIPGLMLGVSELISSTSGEIDAGAAVGTVTAPRFKSPYFFARYEHARLMVAGEYNRLPDTPMIQFPGAPPFYASLDQRNFYVMTSYKATAKLTGGVYYSSSIDRKAAFTSARYEKDWVIAARYDFSPFLYAKAEQHLIRGTETGFAASDNPNIQPATRMTMLKLGVTF
jgi:hypothetical protein